MKKYHRIAIIGVVILSLGSIIFYSYYKNSLYGNTQKEIKSSLSRLYAAEKDNINTIDIIDIIEIDNTKVVAFNYGKESGVATFVVNKNGKYQYLESESGKEEYLIHYGNIDTKRMCATIIKNQSISNVIFLKDNVMKAKWEIEKTDPTFIYYNDESIQNKGFEFEFIYLDKQGNEIENYYGQPTFFLKFGTKVCSMY